MDSVAMLHGLVSFGYEKVILLHLNHKLRKTAGLDEEFAIHEAKRFEMLYETAQVDIKRRAREEKKSLETVGREARLEFFAEMARKYQCPRVFVAHHADDQVETVLMNLFRGTGPGLAGMKPETSMKVGRTTLSLLRPMLGIWRADIEGFVKAVNLHYREDESNLDHTFLRNRVRYSLIPHLYNVFGRDVRSAIWRVAEQHALENEVLESQRPPFNGLIKPLREFPLAIQRRVLKCWLEQQGVPNIDYDLIQRASELIPEDSHRSKINLPGGRFLRRTRGRLYVEG